MYVFGFDNKLVNTEDLIVELTNKVLGIRMTKEFWYENLHSVPDVETEMKILEEAYHVSYTPELQKECGESFVQSLGSTKPNAAVYQLVRENMKTCIFLSGSPLEIMQLYFKAWDIAIPDGRIYAGVYNGSGEKEKILAKLQAESGVTFVDDDARLIKNAQEIVKRAILVKQPYNSFAWDDVETMMVC
ncbi:MAG: hypothetical protein ACOX4I_05510 [Anaerovoracaceae bacterium]